MYRISESGIVYISHLIAGNRRKSELIIVPDIQMILDVLLESYSCHLRETLGDEIILIVFDEMDIMRLP